MRSGASSAPSWRFRPGLGLTCAVLVALVCLVALGTWQLQRLQWKEALIRSAERAAAAAPEPLPALTPDAPEWRDFDFRRLSLSGRFIVGRAFGFQVSTRNETAGGDLVVPFLLDDGRAILIDTGWLPEQSLPPKPARASLPPGLVTLDGVARYVGDVRPGWFTPSPDLMRGRWFDWHIPAMSDQLGVDLLPIVIELDSKSGMKLEDGIKPPASRPQPNAVQVDYRNDHRGYALTWYGLALVLAAIYLRMGLKRGDRSP